MILDYFTKNRNYLILIFTVGYFITFLVNAFIQGNLEFIYYIFLLSGLIFVIVILNRVLHLAFFIIFNLSLMGFFHLLGGNLYLGATRFGGNLEWQIVQKMGRAHAGNHRLTHALLNLFYLWREIG